MTPTATATATRDPRPTREAGTLETVAWPDEAERTYAAYMELARLAHDERVAESTSVSW